MNKTSDSVLVGEKYTVARSGSNIQNMDIIRVTNWHLKGNQKDKI
jgi:hypothetical protein